MWIFNKQEYIFPYDVLYCHDDKQVYIWSWILKEYVLLGKPLDHSKTLKEAIALPTFNT